MTLPLQLAPPVWREGDRHLVGRILFLLAERGSFDSISLKTNIERHVRQIEALGELLDLYPSLFKTQTLGGKNRRNIETLVERLANATTFTFDLMLPMRAVTGKAFLLARLNFMRMLLQVLNTELNGVEDHSPLYESVQAEISNCILARVCEELLMSVICRRDVEIETRRRAALGLTHLWEDRVHFPMREFFPVLVATWEARRRTLVTYGTLSGTAEIFDLMAKGCDPEFLDYFAGDCATEEAIEAFREFLFGLSTEELERLERHKTERNIPVITASDVTSELSPESLTVIAPDDLATRLYMFFMKRHLEASARRLGDLDGPKYTAEEYVLIEFLARHNPSIFGKD